MGRRGKGVELFLSTPSARRATLRSSLITHSTVTISIHALREEGDVVTSTCPLVSHISIHALREEGDLDSTSPTRMCGNFYPRPPRGGRPVRQKICHAG